MKVFKYTLVLIGLVILVFLLIGAFSKTTEFKQEYSINQSTELVFGAFMDPRRMQDWVEGLEKIEPLNGFMNGIGSQYMISFNYKNRKFTILQKVVGFQWKKHLDLMFYPPHMNIRMDLLFEEKSNSTHIFLNTSINGDNLFWRSILFLKKPAIKKIINKNIENLEQMLNT